MIDTIDGEGLEETMRNLPAKFPVIFYFDGAAVLHRKMTKLTQHVAAEYLSMITPNAQVEDFYCQYFSLSEKEGVFSLVRKSDVDPVINAVTSFGGLPCAVALGPFFIGDGLHLLPGETKSLHLPGYRFELSDQHICDFLKTTNDISGRIGIGDVDVPAREFVSYMFGLLFCSCSITRSDFGDRKFTESYEETKMKHLFFRLLRLVLIPFAVLVLGVLVCNAYFNNENKKVSARLKTAWKDKVLADTLAQHRKAKDLLIQKFLNNRVSCAYFADQIASIVPKDVNLTMMNLFPELLLKDPNHKEKGQRLTIYVAGETKTAAAIAEWTEQLMEEEWVLRLESQTYEWNSKRNIGQFSFVICLQNYD